MASNFKCCKLKEQQNLFCLICKNVFHKSCWNRGNKKYIVVRDNLIWCSKDCIDRANPGEDLTCVDDLRNQINELTTEVKEKTAYISRLKRSSASFVDEAERSEQEYLQTIDKQKDIIVKLQSRLEEQTAIVQKMKDRTFIDANTQTIVTRKDVGIQVTGHIKSFMSVASQIEVEQRHKITQKSVDLQSSEMQTDALSASVSSSVQTDLQISLVGSADDELSSLQSKLNELKNLKESMLTSIETLSVENKWLATEADKLRAELLQWTSGSHASVDRVGSLPNAGLTSDENTQVDINSRDRPRVLIFGDVSARGISVNLRNYLDVSSVHIEGVVKTGASLLDISREISVVSLDYTDKDYVIVCLNINNVKEFRSSDFRNILAIGKFSNLIMCYTFDDTYNVSTISKIRNYTSLYLNNRNVSIGLVENNKLHKGLGYRYKRNALCRVLGNYIRDSRIKSNIVLVSVNCSTVTNHNIISDNDSSDESILSCELNPPTATPLAYSQYDRLNGDVISDTNHLDRLSSTQIASTSKQVNLNTDGKDNAFLG